MRINLPNPPLYQENHKMSAKAILHFSAQCLFHLHPKSVRHNTLTVITLFFFFFSQSSNRFVMESALEACWCLQLVYIPTEGPG